MRCLPLRADEPQVRQRPKRKRKRKEMPWMYGKHEGRMKEMSVGENCDGEEKVETRRWRRIDGRVLPKGWSAEA